MINKAIIIGNACGDPEVRYTQNGSAVANFSVATTEKWKDQQSQQQEQTEFHRVVAFARLGEICGEYIKKGSKVYIEGRIQTRQWEDRDGNKRYTTEIVAREMKLLGSKSDNRRDSSQSDMNGARNEEPRMGDSVPF